MDLNSPNPEFYREHDATVTTNLQRQPVRKRPGIEVTKYIRFPLTGREKKSTNAYAVSNLQ